jgi:hypothetical protein
MPNKPSNTIIWTFITYAGIAVFTSLTTHIPFFYTLAQAALILIGLVSIAWRRGETWQKALAFPRAVLDLIYLPILLLIVWSLFGLMGSLRGGGNNSGVNTGISVLCFFGAVVLGWIRAKLGDYLKTPGTD